MLVIQLAKELVQEVAIILACTIAQGVAGQHINIMTIKEDAQYWQSGMAKT